MAPKTTLVLNLLILIVNFVLICVHSEAEVRVLRIATRAPAAQPILRWRPRDPDFPDSASRANRDRVFRDGPVRDRPIRDRPGAIGPVPHTRLLKFLSHLDGVDELSRPQRDAIYAALEHCCSAFPAGAELVRVSRSDPRAVREQVERQVADRLRAADIRDDAQLARLVRVVVASAG